MSAEIDDDARRRAERAERLRPHLVDARQWIDQAEALFCRMEIPHGKRSHLSATTGYVAMNFADGVVALLEQDRITAASALVRPALEAGTRAAWLWYVASDEEIGKYMPDCDIFANKKFYVLVEEVEQHDTFASGLLSKLKNANWKALNGLTHAGSDQIFRNLNKREIASQHQVGECRTMVEIAKIATLLGLISVASAIQKVNHASDIQQLARRVSGPLF